MLRLRNTFGPASMLDSKGVVKINCDIPIISTTKLKKQKVRIGLIQTYF